MSNSDSLVMGLLGGARSTTAYTDKIPPSFDGLSNYQVYRQDVEFWLKLTSLEDEKQGSAIIARLAGEAKSSATSLGTEIIFSKTGVKSILEKLDKLYQIDKTDQLDIDLTTFLDYTWKSSFSVEQFIAGFHTRLDKISSLKLDEKLKGHLLLRQAGLDTHSRNMILGAASGNYAVTSIANSLRQAYRLNNSTPTDVSPGYNSFSRGRGRGRGSTRGRGSGRGRGSNSRRNNYNNSQQHSSDTTPSFYTFHATNPKSAKAIVDSGASCSAVGKNTLDAAMKSLGIPTLDEGPPMQEIHQFGDHDEQKKASISIKFPFNCSTTHRDGNYTKETIRFNIKFDVLEGDLPFLIGNPTLKGMKASINYEYMSFGFRINKVYHRLRLTESGNHILLDMTPTDNSSNSYFSTPGKQATSLYKPTYTQTEQKDQTKSTSSNRAVSHKPFDPKNLKKLHLQLKHGSHTAMRDYLRAANYWNPEFDENIPSLIEECGCIVANPPLPHAVVSSSPVPKSKQTHIGLDVIFIEGVTCLHSVCRLTGWSETTTLSSRRLQEQSDAFMAIQIHRHGIPISVHCDREYNKGEFKILCENLGINLIPVAFVD